MYYYELTERGKIVIAVILVLLLLLVPSAILLYTTLASMPPQPPDGPGSEALTSPPPSQSEVTPPLITVSPPPNGGGLDTPEVTPPDVGGQFPPEISPSAPGAGTENPDPSLPPEPGPIGGDPSEGTLTFLFSPDKQRTLDARTLSMLDDLVKSPKNTEGSMIALEIPQLSDENATKVISTVVNAFTVRGIQEQRIAIIRSPGDIAEGPFEVRLYFIPNNMK